MRRIAVITGTRADYGSYYPLFKKITEDKELSLDIIATGMHVSPQYGNTMKEIVKDGFHITHKIDMLLNSNSGASMAKSLGIGILGITSSLEAISPDILIVLGDRGEMLAGAIAAAHMNIPVFHLHGGEVTGSIDESIRHAITKFAHIHLTATKKYAERIAKLGEDDWRIHIVGAPRLDLLLHDRLLGKSELFNKYKLKPFDDYILMAFHPVTTETDSVERQITHIMQALIKINLPTIVILPNSDAGNFDILQVYHHFKQEKLFYYFTNINHLDYLAFLKHAKALIGNSSSGIIEAPVFKIAAINIGSRQNGRERSANVIDINADKNNIVAAYQYSQSEEFKKILKTTKNIYGNGTASQKIVTILKETEINRRLLQKKITY